MLDPRAPCVAFPRRVQSSLEASLAACIMWLLVPRLWVAFLSLVLLCSASPAQAITVAVVRPPSSSPKLTETMYRLHGELLSLGLGVQIVDGPASHDASDAQSQAWLQELATERDLDAIIAIAGKSAPVAVAVGVMERSPRRFEVSLATVDSNAADASERLAIRAIEVLRSSFLEIDLAARRKQNESAPKAPAARASLEEAGAPSSHPESFGVELGAAALTSLDGVGMAFLPVVRFDWAARSWLLVQVALAGMGSRPTVTKVESRARVAQQYGVLRACYRFRPDQRLHPILALSAGALRTSVEGQTDSPKQAHTADQWSLLLDGSLGVGLRLHGRYHLTLAAHVQVAQPYVAIHFTDEVVASSGRPNLLLTLALGAWL
jgi:hypothetical protein